MLKSKIGIFCGISLLLAGMVSCEKADRRGEQITVKTVDLSLVSNNGKVEIPSNDNYTKLTDGIDIPVVIKLSEPAPRRFMVAIGANDDTIQHLIDAKKLDTAVLLTPDLYSMPGHAEILFGQDHFDFNLHVSLSALERNFGKDLALALTLSDATKDNSIPTAGKTAIIIIHTVQIIKKDEIHYVYYTDAGSLLGLPKADELYEQTPNDLYVPVGISLAGTAGPAFSVTIRSLDDSAQALIDNGGVEPGTVILAEGTDYTVPTEVGFLENKSDASFKIDVKADALRRYYDNKVIIPLTLANPTAHLLDTTKQTLIMVLNPQRLVELDITDQHTAYTTERENTSNANENSSKLIDNQINSKFLLFDFTTAWMQMEFNEPKIADAYTLTSGGDAPGRDPMNWEILGSNDGSTWTVLDTRVNEDFPSRLLTRKFIFDNSTPYKFYRWHVSANAGDDIFQCAEWRLIKTPR